VLVSVAQSWSAPPYIIRPLATFPRANLPLAWPELPNACLESSSF